MLEQPNIQEPLEIFTNWDRFQSPASDLIWTRTEVNSGVEANKAAHDFTTSVASVYRLSTTSVTITELNNDLPGLNRLLNYKKRLRKLWQKSRDPKRKTALNWVSHRKSRDSVEGELSTPRYMEAGMPQGSVLTPHYITCILIIPQATGVHLALFADDICL
jgi:hypothetical protein